MLSTAYKGQQHCEQVSLKSSLARKNGASSSQSSDQQKGRHVSFSGDSSPNRSKSANLFLATQIMCEIGSTLGQKVAAGELTEKEMYREAGEYLSKIQGNVLDPALLLDCPDQVTALLQPDTRKELESLKRSSRNSSSSDSMSELGLESSKEQVKNCFNSCTALDSRGEEYSVEYLANGKGDIDKVAQKWVPVYGKQDNAVAEKGECMIDMQKADYSDVSASMIYDAGTNVDTGITQRTDMPQNFVFEINESFGPRKRKRQPETKSSWWKTGATVVGVGLVGLAGIGLYKYLSH